MPKLIEFIHLIDGGDDPLTAVYSVILHDRLERRRKGERDAFIPLYEKLIGMVAVAIVTGSAGRDDAVREGLKTAHERLDQMAADACADLRRLSRGRDQKGEKVMDRSDKHIARAQMTKDALEGKMWWPASYINRMRLEKIENAMRETADYLEERADVDDGIPNKAMRLQLELEEAIGALQAIKSSPTSIGEGPRDADT